MKHHILLAAASERACTLLKELISKDTCSVATATDGGTIRCIDLSVFDIIIISLPLENESGIELTDDIRKKTDAPILLLAKAEASENIYEHTRRSGAYIVEKPLGKGSIMQAIHFIEVHAENETALRHKLREAEKQNEEQRIVFRAKLKLIEKKGMSEEEAHRFIQQRAMNERKSLRSAAELTIHEVESGEL